MAGKTKIGGTAYTIKGGKTKIGGTAYTIKGGKTKIGGTAKTISFIAEPPSGCIGEFLFNDNLNDTSGNGHNFTNYNVTFASSGLSGLPKCGYFNGANARAQQSYYWSTFKSLSIWFKIPSSWAHMTLLTIGRQGTYPVFDCQLVDTGVMFALFRSYNGSAYAGVSFNVPTDTNWHHLVVTTNGAESVSSDFNVYIDGAKVSTTPFGMTRSRNSIAQESMLGCFYDTTTTYRIWFLGNQTGYRIYDKTLSASEVSALYNGGNGL